ncbi:MAG: pseudouridine synthase [Gammaproteobacteria bacterium]|nr:pseudouridine synthase [Gammaproteobacteria bacterium]MCP5136096.1 pseudouridine synthase [Gammaproteobacteria bacterium]
MKAERQRLDKFLANNVADFSRALAQRAIRRGWVAVNGEPCRDAARHIEPGDDVRLDDQPVVAVGTRYLMLNKPLDYVCTQKDSHHPSVFELLPESWRDHLHIAGRLDADTTGLVLITTDGDWSHRITSPNHAKAKRYHVTLAEPLSDADADTLRNGVELRNEKNATRPAELILIDPTHCQLAIREGKYHQVRRMFAAVGNKVVELHRDAIGSIQLDAGLAPGAWRELSVSERTL